MGSISKGILGGFSGKVGTVIGGTWKGIEYMRSRPGKRTGIATPKQEAQRLRFSLGIGFVSTMGPLLMTTFKDYAVRMTGINNALSYVLRNGIAGVYPNLTLDYANILISRGNLLNAESVRPVVARPNGILRFEWNDNSGVGTAKRTDRAVVVVHSPVLRASLYTWTGSERSTQVEDYDASLFAGQDVETWLAFISEDGRVASNSVYTGQAIVQ